MKLAEALVMRADLQKRIAQMRKRMENSAWVQEGDQPAEEPEALVRELTALINQLEALMTRINLTNAQPGPDGTTVTALLARRDCLTSYVETMRAFLDEASIYITGTNLLTFSNFKLWDPELNTDNGSAYPNAMTISVGVNVKF